MSVLSSDFESPTHEPVGDWMPSRFTPSLTGTEEFVTRGDRLLDFADQHWSIPDAAELVLAFFQRWLIRHVLEVYPDDWPVVALRGQLRFQQVVISMGRQNGKSLIAALFAIYFLVMHKRGPRVIGVASVNRQAKIVYDRVKYAIDNSEPLSRDLRTTETRGITRRVARGRGPGIYQTLPADEDSAQGEPITGAIYDELHLGLMALWDALVIGQSAQDNAMLIGITTAGDDGSDLLIRLYAEGEIAIDGGDERFGFFCWEGASAELTEANVIRANPLIAEGRKSLETTMSNARKMWADETRDKDGLTGRQRVIRYILNLFAEGASDAWTNTAAWNGTETEDEIEHFGDVVYGFERTESWEFAAVTATSKAGDQYRTELVASITDPTPAQLEQIADALAGPGVAFAMPAHTLKAFGRTLKAKGYETWILSAEEIPSASQHAHSVINKRRVQHPPDALVRMQSAQARRRQLTDGWRISASLSSGDIDAVTATIAGIYVATNRPESAIQLF